MGFRAASHRARGKELGVSARQLAGGESPVNGRCNHGPGGFRFGYTGGCTALKVAPYLSRTQTVPWVGGIAVRWVGVAGVV